jgi:hypothetical protein
VEIRLTHCPIAIALYGIFEAEARQRLRVAMREIGLCSPRRLGFRAAIWTEDADFFGTGVAAWTTSRIEILL